jgi:hypothetical protein
MVYALMESPVYTGMCKYGLERGLCKPTIVIWQGGTFLLYILGSIVENL